MKDWNGFEGIFHRGDLPVEDLLELSEPHFRFRPTPAPEMFFRAMLRRDMREVAALDRRREELERRAPKTIITGITSS